MKMGVSYIYLNNIIESMGKKKSNYVFVKHYGRYSVDEVVAKSIMEEHENIEVIYVKFSSNVVSDSYQPFLSIIKNPPSLDKFIILLFIVQCNSFFKYFIGLF